MKRKFVWLPRLPVVLGSIFSLLLVLAIYLLQQQFQKPPHTKRMVQQLTMIQQPPPPVVMQQAPSEPEQKIETLSEVLPEKEAEPAPEQTEEAALGELGLDAEGVAGGDGFGLTAQKGGRALLGGGTPGNVMLWYGGQIKNKLEEGLQNLLAGTTAMHSDYKVLIEVWVDADGRISRSELVGGSGKDDIDQVLRKALIRLRTEIGKPPPENMPQPVKIRLVSRV